MTRLSRHWRMGPTLGVFLATLVPASAAGQCLTATPPAITRAPHAIRFGITPGAAGSAGVSQATVKPRDEAKLTAQLQQLEPRHRALVLHLNRLFWSDGDKGIAAFVKQIRTYKRAGLRSEVQIRYHPPDGHDGDIAGWVKYVHAAVHRLARMRAVTGFAITNEANFPVSPNTSDGAYSDVTDAIVQGVIAAHAETRKPVGFTVAWRYAPSADAQFWQDIGARSTPAFRRALGYVGVQIYPGLIWPPTALPGRTAGRETADALTLLRDCYFPMAHVNPALWVTENGYPTNLGHDEGSQSTDLKTTLDAVHAYSGQLNVTDYRYFNLRDNNTTGTDLFAAVGLLRDDGTRKPAFAVLRRAIRRWGR